MKCKLCKKSVIASGMYWYGIDGHKLDKPSYIRWSHEERSDHIAKVTENEDSND